jgi:hypothetical protein
VKTREVKGSQKEIVILATWMDTVTSWLVDKRGAKKQKKKTCNSRYSLVVNHPTTNLPI